MSSEKFCLKWNDFESNISSAFRELRDDKDFFDVTLACEDDEQVSAHKVILSACSPFFRNILRRNQHQHPLLYLKGIKYSDLQSVLNFMYHGEVNVAQEELNVFLSIAEELKVKGLTQGNDGGSSKRAKSPSLPKPAQPAKKPRPPDPVKMVHQPAAAASSQDDDDIQEVVPVKSEPAPVAVGGAGYGAGAGAEHHLASYEDTDSYYEQYEDQQEYDAGAMVDFAQAGDGNKGISDSLDAQVLSMMYQTENQTWRCSLCGKESKCKRDLWGHIESLHIENHPGYSCNYCGIHVKTKNALRLHVNRKHPVQ